MGILGDSIDRKSKKKTFSINSQIDDLEDMKFGEYSKNFDKRFNRMIERQVSAISKLYDDLDDQTEKSLRQSMKDRTAAMRKSLDDWKDYNNQIREDLSFTEKIATDLFYWNRRRDLRNLERESRYRFDDIAENAEEMSSSIGDMFSKVSDSLREWGNALNINSIANGLSDTTSSLRDIRIELQKYLNMTEDQWSDLREYANEFSKETDYAISNLEYLDNFKTIVVDMKIDDEELAKEYAKITSKFEDFSGVAASELSSLFNMSEYLDDPEYIRKVTSQMMAIQQNKGFRTNAEDLVAATNANYSNFGSIASMMSKGNKDVEKQLSETYIEQAMALTTAANAGKYEGLTDKLYEIMNMESLEIIQDKGLMQLGGMQIQEMMRSGDFLGAAELLISKAEGLESYGGNVLSELGIDTDSEWWSSITKEGNKSELLNAYSEAMNIIDQQTTAAEKFVDTYQPEATKLEELNNKFKASKFGSWIDDLQSELDITLAEGLLIVSAVIDVSQLLFKGIKGIKGIGKFIKGFGGGSTAAAASKSFLGFSNGGAGVINHSFLGSTGNAMASGTGLLGGLANTGSTLVAAGGGGAVSGGAAALAGGASIAGGVIGGASIISGIADIASASTEKTWQEEADKVTEGALKIGGTAAAAGVGAAIGSIVPGVGTAVGALVGAGVGGLATLIWGDDWAQQLTDALDGTKSVKKAIELIDKNSQELSATLAKDQEFDNLIKTYEDLRKKMDSTSESTEDYKSYQEQLNKVVEDINKIYPGYIDLNNDDYKLMDKQIAATQKLADAELALYKARVLGSGEETLEGINSAYEQYSKSKGTYDSAVKESQEHDDYVNWMTEVQSLVQSDGLVWDKTRNTMKQGTISDEDYQKFLDNAMKYYDAGLEVNHGGWAWANKDLFAGMRDSSTILSYAYDEWNTARDKINLDVSEEQADMISKESQLASMLATQMATYESMRTASSWEDVAKNWSTADANDKAILMQIGKIWNSVGSEFYEYLPDVMALEKLANVDLTTDGTIGSHALGLSYVPYDNYPAMLHRGESVLTAQEASSWRQAQNSSWAPNESIELLDALVEMGKIEQEENEDDSSRTDIVDTIKWAVKELTAAISTVSESTNQASSTSTRFETARRYHNFFNFVNI